MSAQSTDIVTVTIPLDELLYPEEIARLDVYKDDCTKKFWLTRIFNKRSPPPPTTTTSSSLSTSTSPAASPSLSTQPTERTKKVQMSRSEYEAYWATDDEGRYIGTQPQGEGREVLRKRLWAELGLFGKSARTGLSERDKTVFRRG